MNVPNIFSQKLHENNASLDWFFWNSKNINAMHRLFWNEESKQKVDIQRTFLNKVQNLWKHAVKTAQEKLKWQRPKVKSKSQVHSMWLDIWSNDKLQQYAVAQKEEFKYGCWTRQIEADPCRLQKKNFAKSRQWFGLRQEILVKSRQKKSLLFCSCVRSNVPGQRITCN